MQVKRFVAPNMRLALKMVREEIGPEAVILSSKRLENSVEILTTLGSESSPVGAGVAASAANDNPFKADRPATASDIQQSRLERELELMQRASRQRASAVSGAMADKPAPAARRAGVDHYAAAESRVSPVAFDPAPDVVELGSLDPVAAAPSAVEGEVAQLRSELQSMRDMLEQQLSSLAWGSYRQQHPRQASLWRRMKRMGLSAAVSHGLLEILPATRAGNEKQQWQLLMARLADWLPVDDSDPIARGGVYVLVGPTGAGKTTTIGKLATRYVLEHGSDQVALVTTDTARIAAYEQLRTFGRILNVPVRIVDSKNNLEQVLHSLRHKKLVLVDTAGLSRQDRRLRQQVNMLNDLSGRVKTLLTLPATSQKPVIKAAYHAYKTRTLAGCILTKLDETSSVGEVLSLAVEKKLPVVYSADGQGIPDHIDVADRKALVRVAIGLARQVATDDGSMADEIGILAGG